MSDLITGKHLEAEDLDGQNIKIELDRFGQWTKTLRFDPLSDEIQKCRHKDIDRMLRPVLKELGYDNKLHRIKYQVLRVVSRSYIDAGPNQYLILVRTEKSASPTVYDSSTAPVELVVGQRVYFNKPIVVEPGIDCLLITAR